ncbi:MAG: hypothetical protein ABIJ20_00155 [Nanoarchaeota archaeon]|nr:hypothetical protein [Nanoarchaeota archaeon]MBU1445127.1 hypothetical protein [Nanoarchaeota archaeon]MBU2406668.1 hypothetical protein [Nanoarchaeota archaeon]MBU2420087.1 hypothetical protein [Nanoarchaeota archaeon]MBU2475554.1 hypothetical protein [Nanoarchaeota archaeon]
MNRKRTCGKKSSTLDKIINTANIALALDAIIVPFLTGKTIHEHLGGFRQQAIIKYWAKEQP